MALAGGARWVAGAIPSHTRKTNTMHAIQGTTITDTNVNDAIAEWVSSEADAITKYGQINVWV